MLRARGHVFSFAPTARARWPLSPWEHAESLRYVPSAHRTRLAQRGARRAAHEVPAWDEQHFDLPVEADLAIHGCRRCGLLSVRWPACTLRGRLLLFRDGLARLPLEDVLLEIEQGLAWIQKLAAPQRVFWMVAVNVRIEAMRAPSANRHVAVWQCSTARHIGMLICVCVAIRQYGSMTIYGSIWQYNTVRHGHRACIRSHSCICHTEGFRRASSSATC